ncbi:hypothetical protein V8D89_007697, partial [Ganoderma adspersum]
HTSDSLYLYEPIGAHDVRKSLSHALRHSMMNLVHSVGELRASPSHASSPSASTQPPNSYLLCP